MFKQISAGFSRSLALLEDNSAWAWGNIGRTEAQLSPDDPLAAICGSAPSEIGHHRYAQPVPQRLNPQMPLTFVSDALNELLALTARGEVAQLAPVASVTSGAATKTIKALGDKLHEVCGNESASYALDSLGRVWSWGNNFQGQLGRPTSSPLNQAPALINSLPRVARLATGMNHTLALTATGEVWAWGANAAGQLGLDHLRAVEKPQRVPINSRVVALAAGDTHSMALDDGGRLYAWGSNHCGQLGPLASKAAVSWTAKPLRVRLPFRVLDFGGGTHYSLALTDQREVYAWGWNGFGQLGQAVAHSQSTSKPAKVSGLGRVEKISVGSFHVLAVEPRGLCAWGDNRNAACGLPVQQAVISKPHFIALA